MKTFCSISKRQTDNIDKVYNMSNMLVILLFCIKCETKD